MVLFAKESPKGVYVKNLVSFHVEHFCLLVISNHLWFANFVSLIYLKTLNNEIYKIATKVKDIFSVHERFPTHY